MPMDRTTKKRAAVAATRRPLPAAGTETTGQRQADAPQPQQADQLDVSRWVEKVKELPDVRREKVEAVRQALADDAYDDVARLEHLLGGLLGDVTPSDSSEE